MGALLGSLAACSEAYLVEEDRADRAEEIRSGLCHHR
jgi:hypothetical protein